MGASGNRTAVGISFVIVALLTVGAFVVSLSSAGGLPAQAPSGLTPAASTAPTVHSHTAFAVATTSTGTSSGFASISGDAIIAFTSIWGHNTVSAVTDSAGDTFTQLAFASNSYGGSNSLAIWAAYNVGGGPG